MALVRRVRKSGGSLVVPLPSDFVKVLDLKPGELIEFLPEGSTTFRIRRVDHSARGG
ncbi:MAG: AbrB/MazE/SpoVT family DNA-binding domain-containing protein [Thermoplasmata archaeon]